MELRVKNLNLSLEKTVLVMWSKIKNKNCQVAINVGRFSYFFFSVSDVLLTKMLIFLLILNIIFFLQETKYVSLLLLYLWAKYEPILLDFTVKTLIFSKLKLVYCSSKLVGTKNHCFASKINLLLKSREK